MVEGRKMGGGLLLADVGRASSSAAEAQVRRETQEIFHVLKGKEQE